MSAKLDSAKQALQDYIAAVAEGTADQEMLDAVGQKYHEVAVEVKETKMADETDSVTLESLLTDFNLFSSELIQAVIDMIMGTEVVEEEPV